MKKLLFVVTEIAPFDKGGIGTFSKNMIRKFSKEFSMAFLYCGDALDDVVERAYPETKFYFPPDGDQRLRGKPASQISEIIANNLDSIFQKDVYDYVEFMDWGGWAHQTLMLKRCGLSNIPATTTIAVRIHSTEHALRKYEHRHLSLKDGETSDFELASLLLADMVVCHVPPIARIVADEIKNLFGRDISGKIVVTPMPVYISTPEKECSIVATPETSIVFSTKTQQIKRPDVFVIGTSLFLDKNKNHKGQVIFAAHLNDDTYTRLVFSLIPRGLRHRFTHDRIFSPAERDSVIANGIIVFPGEYESFCFAAYEASLSGAIVVLNEMNPAFADGTPWEDGVNCIKFDGTSEGLARALERTLSLKRPLQSVRFLLSEPQIIIPDAPPPSQKPQPSIDILIYVRDMKKLSATINSIKLNSFSKETTVRLFLTAATAQAVESNQEMAGKIAGKITVIPDGLHPIMTLRECALESNADYVLFMWSGAELSPNLLEAFAKSFEHQTPDVFSSWTRNSNGDEYLNRFYGVMPLNGWRYNMIAPPLAFYKTALLREYFKKAGGRIFNFYAMHLCFSLTGANYVVSPRNECIIDNPFNEYSIHDSGPVEKSAFYRAVLLDFLPISPPTLAILMTKPELHQAASPPGKALPSLDTYIYRKYIKKIKFLDNIFRFFKIVT